MYTAAVILAIVAPTITIYNRYLWFLSLLIFGLVGLIFYYIHTLKVKLKRTLQQPKNILVGNFPLSDNEQQAKFHKILENYEYLRFNWFRGYLYLYIGIPFGITVGVILSMILYF